MKISENILKYTNEYFQKNEFTIYTEIVYLCFNGKFKISDFEFPIKT